MSTPDPEDITDFLDVLAWMKCPLAQREGFRPKHPAGNPRLAKKILDNFPRSRSGLGDITDSSARAAKWLAGTRYGSARQIKAYPEPPPRGLEDRGYWRGDTGYLYLRSERRLRFELPHLHRVENGAWEIVVLDTSPTPPDPERRADLSIWCSFLQSCFEKLTSEWARVRVLAPAYEMSWSPDIPESRFDEMFGLLHILGPVAFERPGRHCHQTEGPSSKKKWRCPIRAKGHCEYWP